MKWEQQQQKQDQEEEKHLNLSKPFSLTQEDWREFTEQTHTEEFLCTFGGWVKTNEQCGSPYL